MAKLAAIASVHGQRGIVLLAMLALVLVAGSSVVLVGLRTAAQSRAGTDLASTQALAAARAALIGWAVAEPDFPGGLPLPDRNGDGDYNGFSDCTSVTALPAGTPRPNIAIGRLPWLGLESNCQSNTTLGGLSADLRDGAGEGLWYAASANLLRVGNGTAVAPPRVDWSEPFAAPPFNWLTVMDANGNILSNRVAFVVIAPGAPVWRGDLGTGGEVQARTGAAPGADRYLDRFTISGTTYDNADADGVFITAPDNTRGPEGAVSGTDGFNDRLVYVTIDELLPLLVPRVLQETGAALLAYDNAFARFPWAAPFADPAVSTYKSTVPVAPPTQRFGLVPFMRPGETFNTPMTIWWGFMTNAVVSQSGTVTADTMNSPGALSTFTPPGEGTCLWEFEFRVDCINTAVQNVTVASGVMTPWGAPCAAVECQRQFSMTASARFEEAPAVLTAPTATETRTRRVRSTRPRAPASSFSIQIVDITCTAACPAGAVEVGRGTLALGTSTDGIVQVSGVRHELAVVDRLLYPNTASHRSELRYWFFTAGWYKRLMMGIASGRQPGGSGDCTPGANCITVETLDRTATVVATNNAVRAMLVYGGWPVAANGGFSSAQPGSYFELDNTDGDEVFSRPASIAVRNGLEIVGTFNDQLRVVAP